MIVIRKAGKKDKKSLCLLVRNLKDFNKEEQKVAQELLCIALRNNKENHDYKILLAEKNNICGYICYGPTPMTDGTWDIYWVAVSPGNRGKGIGKKLIIHAIEDIENRGGKRIIIDTSSQASYKPARALYASCGFKPVAVIPDYYGRGKNRVTFYKKLKP